MSFQQGSDESGTTSEHSVGQTIYFSATSTILDAIYHWDFGDTASAAGTANGQYVQYAYSAAGSYTVTLTASNPSTTLVAMRNLTIKAGITEEPVSALVLQGPNNAHINFAISLSATVGTGDNVTYVWDFGDGNTGSGVVVYHTYAAPGTYLVTLTASNSQGEQVVTREIVVQHATLLPSIEQ